MTMPKRNEKIEKRNNMETKKAWYKSKTIWFNVAIQVAAIAAVLSNALPILAGIVSIKTMAIIMFVLAVVNQGLRSVTKEGVEL